MTEYIPHSYQRTALEWIKTVPRCALFLDMGLGKTVITLTAVRDLINGCDVSSVLVVAPKKVAETTWTAEAAKWKHLQGLRVVTILGTPTQRAKAADTPADIYVIGRDSLAWLINNHHHRRPPYDMVVIDELTSFKNHRAMRSRALHIATNAADRVVGLTGTPAPNGLLDLWAQIFAIDRGERLGKSFAKFRDLYFHTQTLNHIPIRSTPKAGADKAIRKRIADICLSMQAADYLTLPDCITITERVTLPPNIMRKYRDFERAQVLAIKDPTQQPTTILAASAAALLNKLSQYANGALYDEEHQAHEIHAEKLNKIAEIAEGANASGSGLLVFYQYQHDAARLLAHLSDRRTRIYQGADDLRAWNAGEIDVLLAHPASTAYGLNMQQGGHYIAWLGTGYNLEHYQQANARLHRQGQQHPVTVYRVICADTVDEQAAAAIDRKTNTQQAILDGLSALLQQYNPQHNSETCTTAPDTARTISAASTPSGGDNSATTS